MKLWKFDISMDLNPRQISKVLLVLPINSTEFVGSTIGAHATPVESTAVVYATTTESASVVHTTTVESTVVGHAMSGRNEFMLHKGCLTILHRQNSRATHNAENLPVWRYLLSPEQICSCSSCKDHSLPSADWQTTAHQMQYSSLM